MGHVGVGHAGVGGSCRGRGSCRGGVGYLGVGCVIQGGRGVTSK